MPIRLNDGSVVGDGSQIGMFPVLANQPLDKPSILVRSSTNPRMDLVLLIVKDVASPSAPVSAAPPGMSAAQFALVQRMLAARQRGAQASSGQGVPEPKRGPQIHLVLWRMGDDSSIVWSIVLSFDKVMDSTTNGPGAPQQEHEDVHLHDVAWSPKGDRVGVLASVKRSPVASTSTAIPRTTTFLRTYSVQDGRLLSTVHVGRGKSSTSNCDMFASAMALQWLEIDFAVAGDAVDGSNESILAKFPALPVLPAADTFASAGGTASLMPHQLRMMQMSGQKSPPSFQFPSYLALQGRGPLAKIPNLAMGNASLGLLEGEDAALVLDEDSALPLSPETVVLISHPGSAQAFLILDGQANIGSLKFPRASQEVQEDTPSLWPSRTLSLSRDLTQLSSIAACTNAGISCTQMRLPLPIASRYGPSSVRSKLAAVGRNSHLLRFYLGYALDTASALQQVYQKELVQKVTNEWTKNIDDLSMKFGGDMKYELINVLLTGRAGPAAEQFLLGNLTEGVLTRLEQQSHAAMYAVKKLISESLKPALERCIVCLSGLDGQARFFGERGDGLGVAMRMLQATLDSTLGLAKEVDLEALISQEFYRWCRTERERQERIKQDQDEPRLPITYDVHFVANYIDRGFENEEIHARMGGEIGAEALEQVVGEAPKKPSLQDILEEAQKFLAAPSSADVKADQPKDSSTESKPAKTLLAIVPMLTKAIEVLGDELTKLLDGTMENATVVKAERRRGARGEWSLVGEAALALSLSSSSEVQDRIDRISTASFVSGDTLLCAHILRSHPDDASSSTSILAVRHDMGADEAAFATCHFSVSTVEKLSIVDLGFYGDSELLVLAVLASTSTSVLLAFKISELPFSTVGDDDAEEMMQVAPARATEFEKAFKPAKLAVNTSKQTVVLTEEGGKKALYLDISMVELGDVVMQEQ